MICAVGGNDKTAEERGERSEERVVRRECTEEGRIWENDWPGTCDESTPEFASVHWGQGSGSKGSQLIRGK